MIVLDNDGYGTERFLHAGEWEYNDIQPWKYHKLPEVLGGGTGYEVRTEGEFDAALAKAWNDRSGASLIQAHIPDRRRERRLKAADGAAEQARVGFRIQNDECRMS